MKEFLNTLSILLIPVIISIILIHGLYKKVPVYETFTQGAKEGLGVAFKILPYLIAIMSAVSMFRASGAIEILSNLLSKPLSYFNIPIDTLPVIITRSMSGSATLGVLSDIATSNGANSYAAKLAAVITGSSETTFYVLAVYFGAIGIKKVRFALLAGLLADAFSAVLAVIVCSYFFLY